jgi:hypothetical protein
VDTEYEPPFVHQTGAERANTYMAVESNKLVPLLVAVSCMGLVIAGLGLGVAFWALSYADKARMESRILQVKVEGFEKALWAAKIDPYPHLPGQPE